MRDKVVVITGASAGIGAELARVVGARGGRPVLAARRERELAAATSAAGSEALAVVCDVTRRSEHARLLDAAVARFGRVDAWVNNAGRGISRSVLELTEEDFDEMMLVNVKSALWGMQAVLPHFQERASGHIVNVSSMLGRVPYVGVRSAYSASNNALNSLTANFRMELRQRWPAIHVSTVHPGVVATEFGLNALGGGFDSRKLPSAQPVAEVAEVIADVLERPRADVYTRPMYQQQVVSYYAAEDMAAAESQFGPPGPMPKP